MITRNYTDTDGKSRFADLPLPFVWEEGRERTPLQRATGIRFNRWPVGRFLDWHNPRRRQYVIILAGHAEVGLEDGTVHTLRPGGVALEEDLTGRGHTTRVVGDHPLLFVTVPLEEAGQGNAQGLSTPRQCVRCSRSRVRHAGGPVRSTAVRTGVKDVVTRFAMGPRDVLSCDACPMGGTLPC